MCYIVPPTNSWDTIEKIQYKRYNRKVALIEKQSLKDFQRYRGLFVKETLKIVLNEQFTDFIQNDYINFVIANQGKINACSSCYHTYSKDVGICPCCKLDANYYNHDRVELSHRSKSAMKLLKKTLRKK